MRKRVLFCLFLSAHLSLLSQNWVWDTAATKHQGNRLVKDNFGHIYSFNFNDTVLTKLSVNGSVTWQKSFPSNLEIRSVCCSPDSTVYVMGHFTGNLSLGNNFLNTKGKRDLFLCKLTPAGNIIWSQQIGSKEVDFGGSIAMHGLNVLITGAGSDTTYFPTYIRNKERLPEFFVARFFANGNLDTVAFATHTIFKNQDNWSFGYEVIADHAGNVITIVEITGQALIDTASVVDYGGLYVYKFSSGFNHQWHSKVGSYRDMAQELAINSQDEIILSVDVNGNHSGCGQIRKLPATGGVSTLLYNTKPGFSYGTHGDVSGIDLDTCGNIYFTGGSHYWHGPLSTNIGILFTGQLSPSGNLNWFIQDSTFEYPRGCDIVALGLNKSFVTLFVDSMQINQHIYFSGQVNAILQATFGIPWNTTPLVNQSICANHTTVLKCSTAGFIQWYNSPTANTSIGYGGSFTTSPLAAGIHTFYAEASTCTMVSGRAPVEVTVHPQPVITVPDGSICPGEQFIISPSPPINYNYSSGNPSVTPLNSSSYTLIGQDANGCADTAVVFVYVKVPPSPTVQPDKSPVCIGEPVTLSFTGAQSYSLGNTPVQSTHSFVTGLNSTMLVKATGTNGCSTAMIYNLKVSDCTDLPSIEKTNKLSVYPNPASAVLNIITDQPGHLQLINYLGQIVYSVSMTDRTEQINLMHIKQGAYFLKLKTETETRLEKIIVEK